MHAWLHNLPRSAQARKPNCKNRQARRGKALSLETLESRVLLSTVPVVTTLAATSVLTTAATLNGSVNPEGSTATVRFQYSSDPTFTPTVETSLGSVFFFPFGVAVDAAGNVFVAATQSDSVREILPNGRINSIGSGFNNPHGVAVDAGGDVFVADFGNSAVKEVLPNGTINSIGSGFFAPTGVAVDASGDVFVADYGNNAVKEVLPNGTIKTIGSGFNGPFGVAVDAAGDVFVADYGNNAVKEVLPNGTIMTLGSGFNSPAGVAVDAAGDVFVADTGNSAIKEILPNGTIKSIGSGFSNPHGVAVDAVGDVFVANTNLIQVAEFSPPTVAGAPSPLTGSTAQAVSAAVTSLGRGATYYFRAVAASAAGTVAGATESFTTLIPPTVAPPTVATNAATSVSATGATLNGSVNPAGSTAGAYFQYSTDPTFTPTVQTNFYAPESGPPGGVAVDAAGDVFVGETKTTTVYEVLPNATIKTIGSGFKSPIGVAVDSAGDVFVGDAGNNAVKEVLPDGTVRTLGSGFADPHAVAVDAAGDVFVADSGNSAVKEILPNGTIKTIGSGFNFPTGVAVDASGDVFVADFENNAVYEVLPNGAIKTLGSGFQDPFAVAVDAVGDVFFSAHAVVELSPPTVAAAPSPLTGSTAQAVSGAVTGLVPGTTYYFRVVAASAGGTVAGTTEDFTTTAPNAFLAGVPGDGSPQTFVQNLYRELLGREPDSGGDSFWVNYVQQHNSAAGRSQVISAFLNSPEYAIHYITTLYQVILGRTPDSASLPFWTSKMGSPGTPGQHTGSADEKAIVAAFFGSDEFYINSGNIAQSWINALYEDILGRAPDGSGAAFWANELATRGTGDRDGIVRDLLTTQEAAHFVLDSFYPAVGGTSSNPLPVPGSPAGTVSTDLATITGDGWENLYLEGQYDSQPQGNDAFFTSLAGGAGWDDIQLLLLETSQFYTNPNRPITS